jgi:hypothetical protein
MTNSLPWKPWPIEIDGLPMKNGDFPWQTVKSPEGNLTLTKKTSWCQQSLAFREFITWLN